MSGWSLFRRRPAAPPPEESRVIYTIVDRGLPAASPPSRIARLEAAAEKGDLADLEKVLVVPPESWCFSEDLDLVAALAASRGHFDVAIRIFIYVRHFFDRPSRSCALVYAVERNRIDAVNALLRLGAPLNERAKEGLAVGFNAVRAAVVLGRPEILARFLLPDTGVTKKGVLRKERDESSSLLYAALAFGNSVECAKLVRDAGGRFAEGEDHFWLRDHLLARGNLELMSVFMSLDFACVDGALEKAAFRRKPEMVRCILGFNRAHPHEKSAALFNAVYAGSLECVELLLAAGADTEIETRGAYAPSSSPHTPLLLAIETDQVRAVSALLRAGADIHARTHSGRTCLVQAVFGDAGVVGLLLRAGCDPNMWGGEWPIRVAAKRGRTDIVKMLLYAGADPTPGLGLLFPLNGDNRRM